MKIWLLAAKCFSLKDLDWGLSLLDQDEFARYQRYRNPTLAHHFVMGRTLVRYALSQMSKTPIEAWHLISMPSGQLIARGPKDVFISVSRSTDIAGCFVSFGPPVGFDIECVESSGARCGEVDITAWTELEANLKLCGLGLSQSDAVNLQNDRKRSFHVDVHLDRSYHLCASFLGQRVDDPKRVVDIEVVTRSCSNIVTSSQTYS